jgi:hypothetical protein
MTYGVSGSRGATSTLSTMQFFLVFLVVLTVGLAVYQYVGSVHETLDTRTINNNASVLYTTPIAATTGKGVASANVYAVNNSYLGFNGVNNYVNNTISYIFAQDMSTQNFSYSLWINAINCSSNSTKNSGLIGAYQRTAIQISPDCKIQGGLRNSTYTSDSSIGTGINAITINTWEHILINYVSSSKNYSIYNDNVLLYSKILTVINVTDDNGIKSPTIGRDININGGNGVYLKGSIDEVRIYNRSLTQAEITAIYNSGRIANSSLPSDGLVAWFPFDEYGGTTVYNLANTSNNGVIYGT